MSYRDDLFINMTYAIRDFLWAYSSNDVEVERVQGQALDVLVNATIGWEANKVTPGRLEAVVDQMTGL